MKPEGVMSMLDYRQMTGEQVMQEAKQLIQVMQFTVAAKVDFILFD